MTPRLHQTFALENLSDFNITSENSFNEWL
jgi:hypothetical protein